MSLKVGGDFFYDSTSENSKELLFIAGGVGINPLYSILQEINGSLQDGQLNKDVKVELLYSASSLDELIFKVGYRSVLMPLYTCNFCCDF